MSTSDPRPVTPHLSLGLNEATLGLLATAILLFGAVFWSANGPNVERTDFSLTYVGARIVHQGMGSSLYDINLQIGLRNSLFAHPNPLLYEHPPFEALILSPLAAVPFRMAYLCWGLFNAALLLVLIFLLRPYLPWPREDLAYFCLWLFFAPIGVALYQGQPSLLLLAIFTMAFISLKHENELLAGVCLGIGLFRFQFILPFAFIFLIRRKWRFLSGFALTSLFLVLLSLAAVRWTGLVSYVRFLLNIANNPQNLSYGSGVDMPTIHGFVYAILGQRISHLALNITVAVLSFALLMCIGLRWRPPLRGSSDDLMFAAAVAVSLLTGSHMFAHDFSPLLLPLFLASAYFSRSSFPAGQNRILRILVLLMLILFWIPPAYFVLVAWHRLYLMCPALLAFAFTSLLAARYIGHQTAEVNRVMAGST